MQRNCISVKEARTILGNTAKGLSDDAIERLIDQVYTLTDLIINQVEVSKNQPPLDIQKVEFHTDE